MIQVIRCDGCGDEMSTYLEGRFAVKVFGRFFRSCGFNKKTERGCIRFRFCSLCTFEDVEMEANTPRLIVLVKSALGIAVTESNREQLLN